MSCRGVSFNIALKICLVYFLLLTGCAVLPPTKDIPELESEGVERAFLTMLGKHQHCHRSIDVTVQVSFKSWLQSGTVDGFLQTMSPSYLKFVGTNPFGQPLMILVTDGDSFQFVVVPEAKEYVGDVEAKAFNKYAPEGFDPEEIFYWLAARLSLEKVVVESAAKNKEGPGYWLRIGSSEAPSKSLILFDAEKKRILRRILVNGRGENLMDVQYGKFQEQSDQEGDDCPMPGEITVSSSAHRGSIHIVLNDWLENPVFSPADFHVRPPAGFERIEVK